jgi:glucose/arabinose dehydrogenase
MEFAPDGRLFYAEQLEGAVRIVQPDGSLQPEPFVQFDVADHLGLDWGLTGLALDPQFAANGYVYLFYTEPVSEPAEGAGNPVGRPVIVRYTEQDAVGTERTVISDDFPETSPDYAGFNANGEIHFGPDGMLYASVGDYDLFQDSPETVTSLGTPLGKLLRMKPDGSAPEDNPFAGDPEADPRVYATGFREPFSFTLAADGSIYGADNTTVSCEELNHITAGSDYGWPQMGEFPFSDCSAAPGEQPIYNLAREGMAPGDFLSFVEVSGLAFLAGSSYAQLGDSLIVCESQQSAGPNGEITRGVLRRLTFSDPVTVAASEMIVNNCGRSAAVRDGVVYYANADSIRKLVEAGEAETTGENGEETPPGIPPTP